jgi:UDP-N-acetylmuramoyl-tripeptide--D-alanyl-D-alanine ligase
MIRLDPHRLAKWSNGTWLGNNVPKEIKGFCFDARQLKLGECFVALSSGARDGHEFAKQAVEKGASALLVEHSQELPVPQLVVDDSLLAMGAIGAAVRQHFSGPVVGITGSCGKTSTKEMLRLLLGDCRTHATAGNWNNRIGVPMTLFGLDSVLQDFAVIEAGINQPGEMVELGAMIEADLTIITNIASAHLELLGSLERVAAEKAQLALRSRVHAPIVMPNSVLQFSPFFAYSGRALVLAAEGESVSPESRRVIRYRLHVHGAEHSTIDLRDGSSVERYQIASPSEGMCVNAALAIVAARELGVSVAAVGQRIADWRPSTTRGHLETRGAQSFYIDCYNANPASMYDALTAFVRVARCDRPRIYVLGAMNELGERAVVLHREIGQQLRLRAEDRAYFVGPNTLTQAYFDGAVRAGCTFDQLSMSRDIEKIKSDIAGFSGSLFLKGSRLYALEQLLPPGILNP